MKKLVFILFIGMLISCQQEKAQSSKDIKESLKAVVVGETNAYMEKDYQKWASFWVHSGDVLRLDVSKAGFSQTRGWDKSGGNLESFFKENPEPIASTFENTNYLIFHDAKLGWVAFDQTWTSPAGEKTVAKGVVTLVKKEEDWKIISYTAIQYDADGKEVDTLGRE